MGYTKHVKADRPSLILDFGDGNGSLLVQVDRFDRVENRISYAYRITAGRGDGSTNEFTHEGDDVRVPVRGEGGADLHAAMSTLLSFLGAFAEARRGGSPESENWGAFPDLVAEWAVSMSDEFAMAMLDMGER